MPRLPTANDLGSTTIRPVTSTPNINVEALTAPARATAQIGQTVAGIVQERADAQAKQELSNAQSAFLQGQVDAHQQFQRDNDWQTMGQRYSQTIQKIQEGAASQITDPRAKQEFSNWARMQGIRGQDQIASIAFSKERDHGVASLDTLQQNNLNAALTASDPATKEQLIHSTNNAIQAAQENGYISEDQAVQMRQKWTQKYANDSLSMMEPNERISALQSSSGLSAFLPPDQRQALIKKAAEESLNTRLSQQQLQMYSGDSGMNATVPDDALLDAVFQQESGNRHRDENGNLITSPKGAQGVGQIMPATGKDPGYGIKPLQDDSEQENRRFAGDYLGAMLKKYGGNQVLALAAYNAGPGAVDEWIKNIGDPRTGEITNEQFSASIPSNETRNYVYSVSANAQRMGNVRSVINSPEFKLLDGQQQAQIASRTLQIQDQADSAYRLNIQQRMNDDAAKAQAGVSIDNPVTEAEFIRSLPMSATPAEREQHFQAWERYKDTLALQPVNHFVMQNSATEGLAAIQSLKPSEDDADYQFKAQQYAQAVQNYRSVINARERDPGGWLAQNSPQIQEALQAYQQDPSKGAQFAQAVMVEKSRLGIKSKNILPDSVADGILQQIDNDKEQSVTAIQGIAQQFGPYADQVMQQVQKKAGPTLQVVMAAGNPRAANALWQNRDVKTADLRDALNTSSKGMADTADSEWASQSKDFANTMVSQPGGLNVWNNFNEQGRRLTYLNIQRGMSASDAARQAYEDILGAQYQTEGTWRLPVKYGLDLSDVRDGASHYLDNLKPDQIMPLQGDPRLGDEVNRQQSLSRIKDNAQWVTNADETGLLLTLNGMVVNDAEGNPITAKFDDLSKMGQQNRGAMNSISKFLSAPVKFEAKKGGITPEKALFGDNFQQGVPR